MHSFVHKTPHERFKYVQDRMQLACDRTGRNKDDITLIGVSKGHPAEHITPFLDFDLQHLGESYLQEAESKVPIFSSYKSSVTNHFIGHLQSNKAKKVLELFDCIHSVDSLKLVQELDKRCKQLVSQKPEKFQRYPVFIEVNLSGDVNKSGCKPSDLAPILEFIANKTSHLDAIGLMTISPLETITDEGLHAFFKKTKDLSVKIQEYYPSCNKLSMGMSDDFEIAIEEGATHIRIGTLLFGPRN